MQSNEDHMCVFVLFCYHLLIICFIQIVAMLPAICHTERGTPNYSGSTIIVTETTVFLAVVTLLFYTADKRCRPMLSQRFYLFKIVVIVYSTSWHCGTIIEGPLVRRLFSIECNNHTSLFSMK
jgi:hypothetical protein